jgi:hypothetical protein
MKLELRTIAERTGYTIGRLFVDGVYFCDTLEPQVRNLSKAMKVPGKTAIPAGTYNVLMNVFSSRFGRQNFYLTYANGGKLPRLYNVPYFDGVLIHCGNTAADTEGCILVGKNKEVGKVLDSRETFKRLYSKLTEAYRRGDVITITVKRKSY